jgi:hypothetical protein
MLLFNKAVDIHVLSLDDDDESELFRNNSMCMKTINLVYKDVATHFLINVLAPPMGRFLEKTDLNYEVRFH